MYFIIHIFIYYRNNNKYNINNLCRTKMKTIQFFFQEFKRHVIENTTIQGKLGVQPSHFFFSLDFI